MLLAVGVQIDSGRPSPAVVSVDTLSPVVFAEASVIIWLLSIVGLGWLLKSYISISREPRLMDHTVDTRMICHCECISDTSRTPERCIYSSVLYMARIWAGSCVNGRIEV